MKISHVFRNYEFTARHSSIGESRRRERLQRNACKRTDCKVGLSPSEWRKRGELATINVFAAYSASFKAELEEDLVIQIVFR